MGKPATKSTQKYKAKNYDRIALEVKKGNREKIKQYAESKGKSLNGYIKNLIKTDMKQNGVNLDEN